MSKKSKRHDEEMPVEQVEPQAQEKAEDMPAEPELAQQAEPPVELKAPTRRERIVRACAEMVHEASRILHEANGSGPLGHWDESPPTLQREAVEIASEVFTGSPLEYENDEGECALLTSVIVAMGKALGCQSRSPTTIDLP